MQHYWRCWYLHRKIANILHTTGQYHKQSLSRHASYLYCRTHEDDYSFVGQGMYIILQFYVLVKMYYENGANEDLLYLYIMFVTYRNSVLMTTFTRNFGQITCHFLMNRIKTKHIWYLSESGLRGTEKTTLQEQLVSIAYWSMHPQWQHFYGKGIFTVPFIWRR